MLDWGQQEVWTTCVFLDAESGCLEAQVEGPEAISGKESWDPLVMSAGAGHWEGLGICQP